MKTPHPSCPLWACWRAVDWRSTFGWLRTNHTDCISIPRVLLSWLSSPLQAGQQEKKINKAGYNPIVIWECQTPAQWNCRLELKTMIYPHAIIHDFKAYVDKTKQNKWTANLIWVHSHTNFSVRWGCHRMTANSYMWAWPKSIHSSLYEWSQKVSQCPEGRFGKTVHASGPWAVTKET